MCALCLSYTDFVFAPPIWSIAVCIYHQTVSRDMAHINIISFKEISTISLKSTVCGEYKALSSLILRVLNYLITYTQEK